MTKTMFTAASVSPLPPSSKCVVHVESSVTFSSATHVRSTGNQGSRAFLSMSSSLPTFQSETATSSVRSTTRPGMMHSWHEEKLHSHEHCVPRCLHTETLHVDMQYVPNRHRANLDEVRRTSGNDAPLAQKQSRPVLLVHTDHDANLPAGLPTKKGTQVERNTARQRASTSRYLCPLGVQDNIATTRSERRLLKVQTNADPERIRDISQTLKLSTRKPMDPVADNTAHTKTSHSPERVTEKRQGTATSSPNLGCQGSTRTTRTKMFSELWRFSWI